MPRVGYTQEYKTADSTEYPTLKLNTGEKSRIWMPEAPWMEWYHRIEAPLIENGEAVKEVKQRKNGGTYEATKMDWIGSPWCLGVTGTPENPGPLMQAGVDPANCPVCESAANGTGVQAPQQRFATNIIKFKVRPGTYDLITPVTAEILIWPYTARIYATLFELQTEHGDLRRHDIKLELEDTKGADMWQRMKQIAVIVQPAYTDAKVKAYLQELWAAHPENRATDEQLRAACKGRDVPRNVVMDMVRRAERQWQQASQAGTGGNGSAAAADTAFNGSLADGLDSLLNAGPPADVPFESAPASPSAASPAPTTAVPPASPPAQQPADDPLAEVAAQALDEAREHAAQLTAQAMEQGAREQAVAAAADDLFGGDPSRDAGSVATSAQVSPGTAVLTPPAAAPAGEQVIDFDDLFKD